MKYGHIEIFGSAVEAAQAARVEVVDIVRAIREGEELRYSTWKESKRWYLVKLKSGEVERSECRHSNYCIGRMYTLEMKCNRCAGELPPALRREIDKAEERWSH